VNSTVTSSGVAKGGPGKAQALPNVCCALPLRKMSPYKYRGLLLVRVTIDPGCVLPAC